MSFVTTPLEDIPRIRDECRAGFATGKLRDIAFRKKQLLAVAYMLDDNRKAFAEALYADTHRPNFEVQVNELTVPIAEAVRAYNDVGKWAQTERAPWHPGFWPLGPKTRKEAKGTVLIIGPFNAPIWSTFCPLVGAIAAGNAVVLKMSELSPAVCGLLSELWPKYLDTSVYKLVNGAIPETTKLLELQWDHILYTGSSRVGRIVAVAGAKHLTPVTLELGGKNPVYIDPGCDVELAARRLLWGKCGNSGQMCIAPDYLLVPRHFQDKLVEALAVEYKKFYPNGPAKSDSYGRLATPQQYARVKKMLDGSKGTIVLGGEADASERFIAPTILKDVKPDDSLMEDEIFGPVLPIIPVGDFEEAISIINSMDHALVAYIFTKDNALKAKYFDRTQSGAAVANDCILHAAVDGLPFGGTGGSGSGYHTGKYGFDTFTHLRATIDSPKFIEAVMKNRYAPHTEETTKFLVGRSMPKMPPRNGSSSGWDRRILVGLAVAFGSAAVVAVKASARA